MVRFIISVISAMLLSGSALAASAEPESIELPPCFGFDALANSWGPPAANFSGEHLCAHGFGIAGTVGFAGPHKYGRQVDVIGYCCPLPANALTNIHRWVEESCPEEFLATGYRQSIRGDEIKRVVSQELRCTRIATELYGLGTSQQGLAFRILPSNLVSILIPEFESALRPEFDSAISRIRLPLSIRYGLGRSGQFDWSRDGCVGGTAGEFLVGKLVNRCSKLTFRPLLARIDKDRFQNINPRKCSAVLNIFSPDAHCK